VPRRKKKKRANEYVFDGMSWGGEGRKKLQFHGVSGRNGGRGGKKDHSRPFELADESRRGRKEEGKSRKSWDLGKRGGWMVAIPLFRHLAKGEKRKVLWMPCREAGGKKKKGPARPWFGVDRQGGGGKRGRKVWIEAQTNRKEKEHCPLAPFRGGREDGQGRLTVKERGKGLLFICPEEKGRTSCRWKAISHQRGGGEELKTCPCLLREGKKKRGGGKKGQVQQAKKTGFQLYV